MIKNENNSKKLNLFDSTALVVGSMIGSGIFIVSSDIARSVGSPGWMMVVWLITGILTLIAAISYGELAAMMPKAGGQYVYLREAYNPLTGFLYGWTLFMVIQTGTIAAVGMAFAKFLGVIVPVFSEKNILFDLHFIKINAAELKAIVSIVLLTWLNANGLDYGKRFQNSFTVVKIIIIAAFIGIGLFLVKNSGIAIANKSIMWDAVKWDAGTKSFIPLSGFALIAALGVAMVGSIFTSDAWNNVTFTGGEIKNPKKTLPLSLFLGTLIVTIIYLLMNYVYLLNLPLRGNPEGATIIERGMQFATNDRLGTATMTTLLGESSGIIMALLVIISTIGCNNGLILSGARVYYAMAKDGLFFKGVGELNKKNVPAKGLIVQCIWASLLCLSGTYGQLLDYVVFAVLIFYVLTIFGIIILRIKRPNVDRPYKAIGYPILPAIYIITAVFIMGILLVYKPDYTWPGLIIVIIGIPIYYIRKAMK